MRSPRRGAVYSEKGMVMSLGPIDRRTQLGRKTKDSPRPTDYIKKL